MPDGRVLIGQVWFWLSVILDDKNATIALADHDICVLDVGTHSDECGIPLVAADVNAAEVHPPCRDLFVRFKERPGVGGQIIASWPGFT